LTWSFASIGRNRLVRRGSAIAVAVVAMASLAACSNGHIVASKAEQFYATLPSGWRVYGVKAIKSDKDLNTLISTPPQFLAVASSNPRPHAADVLSSSNYPWAIALVRPLSATEKSQMSLEGLGDILIPVDELSQLGDSVQLLSQPTEQVNGALHGIVMAVELQGPTGGQIAYEQSAWVNSATSKVWLLMVGCSPSCYQAQQSVISRIIDSFVVTDRGNT
jgi:hypothetical protein